MKNKRLIFYLIWVAFIFVLDRVTKYCALNLSETVHLNQYLAFELTINRGVTAGLFYFDNALLFALLTLLIITITAIISWQACTWYAHGKSIIGHTAIIAGSLSNICDRFVYGGVVDMIAVHYKNYYFPVFNVADMAIVFGVFVLCIQLCYQD